MREVESSLEDIRNALETIDVDGRTMKASLSWQKEVAFDGYRATLRAENGCAASCVIDSLAVMSSISANDVVIKTVKKLAEMIKAETRKAKKEEKMPSWTFEGTPTHELSAEDLWRMKDMISASEPGMMALPTRTVSESSYRYEPRTSLPATSYIPTRSEGESKIADAFRDMAEEKISVSDYMAAEKTSRRDRAKDAPVYSSTISGKTADTVWIDEASTFFGADARRAEAMRVAAEAMKSGAIPNEALKEQIRKLTGICEEILKGEPEKAEARSIEEERADAGYGDW